MSNLPRFETFEEWLSKIKQKLADDPMTVDADEIEKLISELEHYQEIARYYRELAGQKKLG